MQPNAGAAAVVFYARLFALAPGLTTLFRGDMLEHGEKLMRMIDAAVQLLHDMPGLVAALQELGRRHAGYGAKPAHYALVGTAFIGTLHETLGDAFDSQTRAAWMAVLQLLATTMIDATQSPTAAVQAEFSGRGECVSNAPDVAIAVAQQASGANR